MAGRPFMRAMEKRIEEMGGPEVIMDLVADGATVAEVAEVMGCSRRYVYVWLHQPKWNGRLKEMWAEAQRISAEVEIEKSLAEFNRLDRIIDIDPVTKEPIHRIPQSSEVALATGRAKWRQWMAARKDPERYGDSNQSVNVNVNLGSLHLDALQAVKAREALPARTPEVLEAEVLEDD